jgi:MoxR-like ATPase
LSLRDKLKEQEKVIETRLFGMNQTVKIFCLSKASDLTVLMIGPHGIAKSTLARSWSDTTGLSFRIVTSSEVEEALIAYIDPAVFRKENRVEMKRGELMTKDHILVDEFFLWNNRYRAKLHQLLEERTYAGLDVLTKTFTFATNPLTEYYAGQIEEYNYATMDRIDIFLPVYQPDILSSQKMMRKFSQYGRREPKLESIIGWKEYEDMQKEILSVQFPSSLIVWLSLLAEELSCCRYVKDKFSISKAKLKMYCGECNRKESICAKAACSKPRMLRASSLLAKGLAWYRGEDKVKFEDLMEAIKFTLPHRLLLTSDGLQLTESESTIQTLIYQFNEQMEMIKNRGIFEKLEKINNASTSKTPKFSSEDANALKVELAEDLPYLNYANELIEFAKKRVEEFFKKKASKITTPVELELFKEELEKSELDPYSRKDILDGVILNGNQVK